MPRLLSCLCLMLAQCMPCTCCPFLHKRTHTWLTLLTIYFQQAHCTAFCNRWNDFLLINLDHLFRMRILMLVSWYIYWDVLFVSYVLWYTCMMLWYPYSQCRPKWIWLIAIESCWYLHQKGITMTLIQRTCEAKHTVTLLLNTGITLESLTEGS